MEEKKPPEVPPKYHTIILRPWPKIIFFYPTMLTAFVIGIWQLIEQPKVVEPAAAVPAAPAAPEPAAPAAPDAGAPAAPAAPEAGAPAPVPPRYVRAGDTSIGLVFFTVFALNLLVIAFEFTRLKSVAIFCLLLAIAFLLLYLGTKMPVFVFIWHLVERLRISASTSFYFTLGTFFFIVYVGVFVSTRWNYFEIRHNEIVHHTGFLGDIKRFPSPNLKFTKEITDVFEFGLLGSGRVILYPASEKEAIVLDNILNVNRAEREMKTLLSSLAVEVSGHEHLDEEKV